MMTVGVQVLLVTVAVGSSPAVISAPASGLLRLSHPTFAARISSFAFCQDQTQHRSKPCHSVAGETAAVKVGPSLMSVQAMVDARNC